MWEKQVSTRDQADSPQRTGAAAVGHQVIGTIFRIKALSMLGLWTIGCRQVTRARLRPISRHLKKQHSHPEPISNTISNIINSRWTGMHISSQACQPWPKYSRDLSLV